MKIADQMAEDFAFPRCGQVIEVIEGGLPLVAADQRARIAEEKQLVAGTGEGKRESLWAIAIGDCPVRVAARQADESHVCLAVAECQGPVNFDVQPRGP